MILALFMGWIFGLATGIIIGRGDKENEMTYDITNRRFSRLVAMERFGKKWLFQCDCGQQKLINRYLVCAGKIQSCGCLQSERTSESNAARSSGIRDTLTYQRWAAMMDRAGRPSSAKRKYHGGRGIQVCERWKIYENFLEDMGECPPGLSLDRFPNNGGNYEPGNARWATATEQANNQRHGNQHGSAT